MKQPGSHGNTEQVNVLSCTQPPPLPIMQLICLTNDTNENNSIILNCYFMTCMVTQSQKNVPTI